ncbi:uncharacterized protein LOC124444498 [Xenia sp. Carnegie-2017]|uniref:uncharacterized protein LOC124444498 n=1 Tax=Xenia sp. Carnegie-2017 TaxID=2897299 RepID=UPI001F03E973|nr:uncharacterized protein LOC124444498 [Xenia sp. Carnegie-2017]
MEMATRVKSSVRKALVFLCLFTFFTKCFSLIVDKDYVSIYENAKHYWPLQKIVNNTSVDTKSSIHASIIDAAILNETKIFGAAIMLDGTDDWIDLEPMKNDECTTTSKCPHGFTVVLWLKHLGGKFLLCTGMYRNSRGPGIKFTFENDWFLIKVSTFTHSWILKSKLISGRWVHVAFVWSLDVGIIFYINGKEKGKSQPKINEIFTKLESNLGWSIGRPNDISQLNNYGHLGISHLAYWPRQLTQFEINTAYYETVLSEQKKLRDFIASKSPTSKTDFSLKTSGNSRSAAVHPSNLVNCGCLFLCFSFPFFDLGKQRMRQKCHEK